MDRNVRVELRPLAARTVPARGFRQAAGFPEARRLLADAEQTARIVRHAADGTAAEQSYDIPAPATPSAAGPASATPA